MSFQFKEEEIAVLKNFAGIHVSMLIRPTGIKVVNTAGSCIGLYDFKEPYDFEEFGIYEVPEFLGVLSAYKNPEIKVADNFVTIFEGSSKVKYFTTAKNLIPVVKDAKKKCDSLPAVLEFVFPQEKLVMLRKMASLLKAEKVFFETTETGKIRITVGNELEASNNTWDVVIDTDITANNATRPLFCAESELRIITSDYKVKMAEMEVAGKKKGISYWKSEMGAEYFTALSVI